MNILPEMDRSLVEAFLGPFEKKNSNVFAKFERGRTKIDPMEKYNTIHCNIMATI